MHTLHDSASAEAYCTLAGEVIPQKVSQAIAERFSIPMLPPSLPARAVAPGARDREASIDEGVKRELTKVLLDVYMSGGYVLRFPLHPVKMQYVNDVCILIHVSSLGSVGSLWRRVRHGC